MTDADYGLHVWPCAEYLSGFILANKDLFAGKSVLELGGGTALAGITAAKCGSKVILSDRDDERLKNLSISNCRQNGLTDIEFVPVTWGRFEANLLSLPLIDIIISSDCFYDPSVFQPILVTVSFLMEKNPETKFYFSYQERSSDWNIELYLRKWNIQCEKLPYVCHDSVHIGLITKLK